MTACERIDNIPADEDRVLYIEAIACIDAGAKRAGYITLWLSAAESLKRRFRELSLRDGEAAKIVGSIEAEEKAHRSVDKLLLNSAHKYGLITDAEQTRLVHIFELRCLFAHPYEESPTDEAIQAAAAEIVEIVLSEPVKLTRGYLADQAKLLTTDKAFLDNLRATVESYAADVYNRADPKHSHWFVQKLFKEMEPMAGDPTVSHLFNRCVWFAAKYLVCGLPESLGKWDLVSELPKYPEASPWVFGHSDLFSKLDKHGKDYVVNRLLEIGKRKGGGLRVVDRLNAFGHLKSRHVEKFEAVVRDQKLEFLVGAGLSSHHFVENVVGTLKSYNWYTQNDGVKALKAIGREGIAKLDPKNQGRLGNNLLQAAEGSCKTANELLNEIGASKEPWPAAFVEGIFTECFVNDDNRIRFKGSAASQAVRALSHLQEMERTHIIDTLKDRITKGEPKDAWRFAKRRDEMIETIKEEVGRDGDKLKPALELVKALEKVEIPKDDDD